MYINMFTHTHIYKHMRIRMYIHIYMYIYVCMCVRVCIYIAGHVTAAPCDIVSDFAKKYAGVLVLFFCGVWDYV